MRFDNPKRVLSWFVILIGVLALLPWFIKADKETGNRIEFSCASGFYEDTINLKLSAPKGAKIYYTLDGSIPTEDSICYKEPIVINDSSNNENTYSMLTDVAACFSEEDISEYVLDTPLCYAPSQKIDKCTVVQAMYIDKYGRQSDVQTECYFVGFDEKQGYNDLYVISIITNPDNMFGDDGIYNLGDDGLDDINNANYEQRGKAGEREATIICFDANKNTVLKQQCGIQTKGGYSRKWVPRSFELIADYKYDYHNKFEYDFWGTGYQADRLTLFSGANDVDSKCMDCLVQRLVEGRDVAVLHYTPCAVFLDGEYWGFYWITESFDANYCSYYFGVNESNLALVKNAMMVEGSDINEYKELISFAENNDLSDLKNYAWIESQVDMQSIWDYFAIQAYIGNFDVFDANNIALWKSTFPDGGYYGNQKWRWMLFDVNHSMIDAESLESIETLRGNVISFDHLCENEEFKTGYINTCMDIRNTVFATDRVNETYSEILNTVEIPMELNADRYYGGNQQLFIDKTNYIQDFMERRYDVFPTMVAEEFDIVADLDSLHLSVNDNKGGKIRVNSLVLDMDDEWSGEYFEEVPITIEAIPEDGYVFEGWSGDIDSSDSLVVLNLKKDDVYIEAKFKKVD